MGWEGMKWDGMGWDGMGRDEVGWEGMGREAIELGVGVGGHGGTRTFETSSKTRFSSRSIASRLRWTRHDGRSGVGRRGRGGEGGKERLGSGGIVRGGVG